MSRHSHKIWPDGFDPGVWRGGIRDGPRDDLPPSRFAGGGGQGQLRPAAAGRPGQALERGTSRLVERPPAQQLGQGCDGILELGAAGGIGTDDPAPVEDDLGGDGQGIEGAFQEQRAGAVAFPDEGEPHPGEQGKPYQDPGQAAHHPSSPELPPPRLRQGRPRHSMTAGPRFGEKERASRQSCSLANKSLQFCHDARGGQGENYAVPDAQGGRIYCHQ